MLKNFIFLLFLFTFSSCSPKVTLAPEVKNEIPLTLALLPTHYPSGIQKERVDYLHQALAAELRANNYVVLEQAITSKMCSSEKCIERKQISERFGVSGFVSLDIQSVSRNNFLAGYYNAISGTLKISDLNNIEKARVEYTEQEKGGLVFNSGQVFQGIISQVRNASSEREDFLADRFIKSLVSALPKLTPQTIAKQETALEISAVEVKELKPRVNQVCLQGPSQQIALLRYNGLRSTLREESQGRYCGIFRFDLASARGPLSVEIRSPFGVTATKELSLKSVKPCELDGRVKLVRADGKNRLTIECLALTHQMSERSDAQCEKGVLNCDINKFLVYRSDSAAGPFQKVAEITKPSWVDMIQSAAAYYAIIAIDHTGAQSVPISASFH